MSLLILFIILSVCSDYSYFSLSSYSVNFGTLYISWEWIGLLSVDSLTKISFLIHYHGRGYPAIISIDFNINLA